MLDYDGAQLIDSAGDTIGTIDRSYLDESGAVRYVDVKLGSILGRHHLVPADAAHQTPEGVRVPYLKDEIEESPPISAGDTLQGDDLARVRLYYSMDFGAIDSPAGDEADHSKATELSVAP